MHRIYMLICYPAGGSFLMRKVPLFELLLLPVALATIASLRAQPPLTRRSYCASSVSGHLNGQILTYHLNPPSETAE